MLLPAQVGGDDVRSKPVLLSLRFLVTAGLLVYVVARVDWKTAGELLGRTSLFYLFLSFAVSAALILTSVLKWALLLQVRQRKMPIRRLFSLYLVGYFFNHVLPSNVGGDVVRAYEAGREMGDQPSAIASVFVERFTGLTALMIVACISFVSNLQLFGDLRFAAALGAGLLIYGGILALVLKEGPIGRLQRRVGTGSLLGRGLSKLGVLQEAVSSYLGHPRLLWVAMALSFAFYVLAVVNVYVSSLAFGTIVSLRVLVVIVPVILVVSMIPISVGGIGLQEWAYFFTFAAAGIGGSAGVLVALLMRVKSVVFGIAGGVLHSRRYAAPSSARAGP
jgi:uncharacterized protein (TIRG00374 family)